MYMQVSFTLRKVKEIIPRLEKLKKQINNSLTKRFEYLCQRAKENSFDLVISFIS
jgi:hypothetical protein